ncbi:tape measure protein [Bifidobacterium aerophilum]|uniref:Tape measure protein n=1 Tax=Bifidobacterium aerophilum TaxID=1798155 RepID=A0A6N9Z7Q8_9BIFI|nr:tape measure protein [Bifidobacterium aerophilum]NEG90658.1 tape measure protein [Bifidobacterium aerophilum]
MAEELGTGYILIQPSTKGLGKAIEGSIDDGTSTGVKKSGKTILSRVGGAFKTVGKIGVGAVGTVTGAIAGLAAKGGFDRALNIERARTKLKALGHDTKSVDGIMSDALASVKGTAFGLGDAASVAAGLVASGIKQGKSLATVLGTVGDVAQVSGRSFQDMGLIFQQVAAKGKLQGDEMLQLMQSGIPVLQYLADHFKVTSAEAQKMVSDGKVSFEEFEAAMREHLGGAAKNAGDSFEGAMGNVRAALSRLGETIATPVSR